MNSSPAEMAHTVYQAVIPVKLCKLTCTSHMLRILVHLDGNNNLATVAKKAGLSIKEAITAVSQLSAAKLVQQVNTGSSILGPDFFSFLKQQLSSVLGPIAEILIEDALGDLGLNKNEFPLFKAAELVELLAKDIQNAEKRITFQKNMVARIKQE